MAWRTWFCLIVLLAAIALAGPTIALVVAALPCNNLAAPPQTDCPTSGSKCDKRYTKSACSGTAQYPISGIWGPCQSATAFDYCFDAPADSDCYNVYTCKWTGSETEGKCAQDIKQSTEPKRPVQDYPDCVPSL